MSTENMNSPGFRTRFPACAGISRNYSLCRCACRGLEIGVPIKVVLISEIICWQTQILVQLSSPLGGVIDSSAVAHVPHPRINVHMQHTLRNLSDAQWSVLDALIPEPERREDGRGRPWRGRREVLDGILFILRTGAPWVDLPDHYPPYQTCHRRFQQWVRTGVMKGILEAVALGRV
jgi:hypothetical protein